MTAVKLTYVRDNVTGQEEIYIHNYICTYVDY